MNEEIKEKRKERKVTIAKQFNCLETNEDRKEYLNHIKYRLGKLDIDDITNKDLNDLKEELVFYSNVISWSLSVQKEENKK